MWHADETISFISGLWIGILCASVFCTLLAGYVWVALTPGNDHALSEQEIMNRLGEQWGGIDEFH